MVEAVTDHDYADDKGYAMTKTIRPVMLVSLAGLLLLASCANVNDAINLRKLPPDEFQVVFRPPLTLPPDFSLRPEASTVNGSATIGGGQVDISAVGLTDELLTDKQRGDASGFDVLFGTDEIVPNIRNTIDSETLGVQLDARVPAEVFFGGVPDVGPELDAEAEAFRIRQAIKDGQPLTETPTVGRSLSGGDTLAIE
ncbi:MAG: DUF3035 domain-containing protein [Proteobacteria bacterium]|nr:DUF3035 domain-containing protein [Pseudomonadota bacterium]